MKKQRSGVRRTNRRNAPTTGQSLIGFDIFSPDSIYTKVPSDVGDVLSCVEELKSKDFKRYPSAIAAFEQHLPQLDSEVLNAVLPHWFTFASRIITHPKDSELSSSEIKASIYRTHKTIVQLCPNLLHNYESTIWYIYLLGINDTVEGATRAHLAAVASSMAEVKSDGIPSAVCQLVVTDLVDTLANALSSVKSSQNACIHFQRIKQLKQCLFHILKSYPIIFSCSAFGNVQALSQLLTNATVLDAAHSESPELRAHVNQVLCMMSHSAFDLLDSSDQSILYSIICRRIKAEQNDEILQMLSHSLFAILAKENPNQPRTPAITQKRFREDVFHAVVGKIDSGLCQCPDLVAKWTQYLIDSPRNTDAATWSRFLQARMKGLIVHWSPRSDSIIPLLSSHCQLIVRLLQDTTFAENDYEPIVNTALDHVLRKRFASFPMSAFEILLSAGPVEQSNALRHLSKSMDLHFAFGDKPASFSDDFELFASMLLCCKTDVNVSVLKYSFNSLSGCLASLLRGNSDGLNAFLAVVERLYDLSMLPLFVGAIDVDFPDRSLETYLLGYLVGNADNVRQSHDGSECERQWTQMLRFFAAWAKYLGVTGEVVKHDMFKKLLQTMTVNKRLAVHIQILIDTDPALFPPKLMECLTLDILTEVNITVRGQPVMSILLQHLEEQPVFRRNLFDTIKQSFNPVFSRTVCAHMLQSSVSTIASMELSERRFLVEFAIRHMEPNELNISALWLQLILIEPEVDYQRNSIAIVAHMHVHWVVSGDQRMYEMMPRFIKLFFNPWTPAIITEGAIYNNAMHLLPLYLNTFLCLIRSILSNMSVSIPCCELESGCVSIEEMAQLVDESTPHTHNKHAYQICSFLIAMVNNLRFENDYSEDALVSATVQEIFWLCCLGVGWLVHEPTRGDAQEVLQLVKQIYALYSSTSWVATEQHGNAGRTLEVDELMDLPVEFRSIIRTAYRKLQGLGFARAHMGNTCDNTNCSMTESASAEKSWPYLPLKDYDSRYLLKNFLVVHHSGLFDQVITRMQDLRPSSDAEVSRKRWCRARGDDICVFVKSWTLLLNLLDVDCAERSNKACVANENERLSLLVCQRLLECGKHCQGKGVITNAITHILTSFYKVIANSSKLTRVNRCMFLKYTQLASAVDACLKDWPLRVATLQILQQVAQAPTTGFLTSKLLIGGLHCRIWPIRRSAYNLVNVLIGSFTDPQALPFTLRDGPLSVGDQTPAGSKDVPAGQSEEPQSDGAKNVQKIVFDAVFSPIISYHGILLEYGSDQAKGALVEPWLPPMLVRNAELRDSLAEFKEKVPFLIEKSLCLRLLFTVVDELPMDLSDPDVQDSLKQSCAVKSAIVCVAGLYGLLRKWTRHTPSEVYPGTINADKLCLVRDHLPMTLLSIMPKDVRANMAVLSRAVVQAFNECISTFTVPKLIIERFNECSRRIREKGLPVGLHIVPIAQNRELLVDFKMDDNHKISARIDVSDKYPIEPLTICLTSCSLEGSFMEYWSNQFIRFASDVMPSWCDLVCEWQKAFTAKINGVDPCPVCFAVLSSFGKTPDLECKTCHKSFHSTCVSRWFWTSSTNRCPHCRSDM